MGASTENVVGIDFGTTYSAIAAIDTNGQALTLPNREGEMLTPSVVYLDGDEAVVGPAARDAAHEQPDKVASLIKRRMGHASYGRLVSDREFRPETLAALVLRKLIQDAELRIGPITRAVITVPAYFDDTRRKATKDAGRIAGLEVIDIIDEPIAAALSYSFQPRPGVHGLKVDEALPEQRQTVLVYDLGGGTFDVTVVRLSRKRFEAVAIEGDVRLGGEDWDDRLAEYAAEQFQRVYSENPRDDPRSWAALRAAAERAKRTLSKLPQTIIACNHAGYSLNVPITRTEFESLTRDLLTRTRLTTQQLLREAGMGWPDIDRILLVGGSTHMPMTRRMLEEISGKTPDHTLAVSEVVARGAAIHAGIVAARTGDNGHVLDAEVRDALEKIIEINVNAHGLGIEVMHQNERINDILIAKNTQLPAAASRIYRTIAENQQRVRVKVLQGDAHQADACISIGECWIEGLPPNLPRRSPVQVRCSCGSNGLVDVTARDMTSGRFARTTLHRGSGLAEEEIQREADFVRRLRVQ